MVCQLLVFLHALFRKGAVRILPRRSQCTTWQYNCLAAAAAHAGLPVTLLHPCSPLWVSLHAYLHACSHKDQVIHARHSSKATVGTTPHGHTVVATDLLRTTKQCL